MSKIMTGAEMVVQALQDQGVTRFLAIRAARFCRFMTRCSIRTRSITFSFAMNRARRTPRKAMPARPARSACAGHVRSRRHQRHHRVDRRLDGFDPDCLHHRTGADASDRLRRFSGMRHGRHHPPLHQAQLSRAQDRGSAAHSARGLLYRPFRPSRSGGDRHSQGRAVRNGNLFGAARTSSTRPISRRSRPRSPRSNKPWR